MASFDLAATLDNLGSDSELLSQLAELFAAGFEEQCSEIESAAAAGDAVALGKAAHRFKGSAGIFIGCAAAVHAAALEQECKSGLPPDAVAKSERVLAAARELNAELQHLLLG
jgi:HPt (histidine-containing phosphotransfer) domain-containing protein